MLNRIWYGTIPAARVLRGRPRGAASSSAQRKPRRGIAGVFMIRRSALGGNPIALNNKQHRGAKVHAQVSDFHNLSDHAAIGSISVGSLFLTLPTRVLTGQAIMLSEG